MRSQPVRLERLAGLQALKTKAGEARLADAIASCRQARDELSLRVGQIASAEERLAILLSGDGFDLVNWRIACAAMGQLETSRAASAKRVLAAQDREHDRRQTLHNERRIEERVCAMARDAAKHLSARKDDDATAETIAIALARQVGVQR